jgi:hypothetical protein
MTEGIWRMFAEERGIDCLAGFECEVDIYSRLSPLMRSVQKAKRGVCLNVGSATSDVIVLAGRV